MTRSRISAILAKLPPYSGIILSTRRTLAPRVTRRRANAEPIKPRPPVITTRAPLKTSRRKSGFEPTFFSPVRQPRQNAYHRVSDLHAAPVYHETTTLPIEELFQKRQVLTYSEEELLRKFGKLAHCLLSNAGNSAGSRCINSFDNGGRRAFVGLETKTGNKQGLRSDSNPHRCDTIWLCVKPDRQICFRTNYPPATASMAGRVPSCPLEQGFLRIMTAPRWRVLAALQAPSRGLCGKERLAEQR